MEEAALLKFLIVFFFVVEDHVLGLAHAKQAFCHELHTQPQEPAGFRDEGGDRNQDLQDLQEGRKARKGIF